MIMTILAALVARIRLYVEAIAEGRRMHHEMMRRHPGLFGRE